MVYNGNMTPKYLKIAIVALSVLIALLVFFLALQYRTLRREQILNARGLWISNALKRHGPPTASEVSVVRPWMTFDYVNALFGAPRDYLQVQLSITDVRYPQISISEYAEENNMDVNGFLQNVESALRTFLTPAASSTKKI